METKEKEKSSVGLKAGIGTLLIVFFSIAIFLVADMAFGFQDFDRKMKLGPDPQMMMLSTMLSGIMLLLSIYLVYTYLKDYLELRSRFTLGVLSAVIAFMLFAISSNPLLHSFLGVDAKGVFQMIPYFFAMISLAMLAWVSSK